jgi:DNA-binding LacI/PurR family transcriptional regulator
MPTMSDVARAAHVSRFTVSKVLAGDTTVKAAIRARVEAAARTLLYVPNPHAVSLVRGKTATIGIVVSQISDPFYGEIIEVADRWAQQLGRQLVIQCSFGEPAREEQIIQHFLAVRVTGIIIAPCVTPENHALLARVEGSVPVVYIDRFFKPDCHYVVNDHYAAAKSVTEHLFTCGRTPAYLGSYQPRSNRAIADRERGYIDTVLAHKGRPLLIPNVSPLQRDNEQFGFENMDAWLRAHPSPPALFCATDAIALGAMHALENHGLQPGKQVLIAGHDDLPFSAYTHPPLTTVRQPKAKMAEAAVDAVVMLSGRRPPKSFIRKKFKSELVVRESTKWRKL